jgi:hypothetical protein
MATFQQSRQPDQQATQATPTAKVAQQIGGAALSIRLWRAKDSAQSSDLSWQGNDPAVCLTADLIAASQGVVATWNGRFLVVGFSGVQQAVLTARRLQWALLGFCEADKFAGTACAILVHSASDLPALQADASALLPLENAAPGKILLTAKTAEFLQDLPGLPLRPNSDTGLSELVWRHQTETASLPSDDEVLSQFAKQHGIEIEAQAPPQQPQAPAPPGAPAGTDRGMRPLPGNAGMEAPKPEGGEAAPFDSELQDPPRSGNLRLLIGAACAAVILIVVVVIALTHKDAANSSAAAPPAPSVAAPVSSATQPPQSQTESPAPIANASTPPEPQKPAEPTQKERKRDEAARASQAAADAAKSQANQPKVVAGNCDLEANLVPKMLEQAERSRVQGNYPAALRQYRAVLACDRNNARARSGLDLTEFAMQHR